MAQAYYKKHPMTLTEETIWAGIGSTLAECEDRALPYGEIADPSPPAENPEEPKT